MPNAIRTTYGTPRSRPDPMELRAGSKISVSRPWAITRASPRPPTSKARVATIGWMPKREISTPFTTPMDAPPRSAIDDRDGRAVAEVERQQGGRDRHDRADGEVDATRADDQRHAEGDDRDRDDLDELQSDVVDLGEAWGEHEVEGDEEQEPHVDAALGDPVEGLVAAERAPPRGELS